MTWIIYMLNGLLLYLQKHPRVGLTSSGLTILISIQEAIGQGLTWAATALAIVLTVLTIYAKLLEIKERKQNLKDKRGQDRDSKSV